MHNDSLDLKDKANSDKMMTIKDIVKNLIKTNLKHC